MSVIPLRPQQWSDEQIKLTATKSTCGYQHVDEKYRQPLFDMHFIF